MELFCPFASYGDAVGCWVDEGGVRLPSAGLWWWQAAKNQLCSGYRGADAQQNQQ